MAQARVAFVPTHLVTIYALAALIADLLEPEPDSALTALRAARHARRRFEPQAAAERQQAPHPTASIASRAVRRTRPTVVSGRGSPARIRKLKVSRCFAEGLMGSRAV
jgi:hypothetical protein